MCVRACSGLADFSSVVLPFVLHASGRREAEGLTETCQVRVVQTYGADGSSVAAEVGRDIMLQLQ